VFKTIRDFQLLAVKCDEFRKQCDKIPYRRPKETKYMIWLPDIPAPNLASSSVSLMLPGKFRLAEEI
jgi:hypothetical protein